MRYVMLLSMLAACGNSLRDDRFPTGSSTIVTNRSHDAVYNVNVDEGTVSRTDLVTGAVSEVEVGSEPTRIARVGDELWVTLKGERGIGVLSDDEGSMKMQQTLPAGIEPAGIVATEDGRRVYVANTGSDQVTEYDGRTREKLRTFPVQDAPRFLALHPNDRVLFVASTRNGTLSWIDLANGEVHPMDLPETSRDTQDGEVPLGPRITGDISVLPDGTEFAVPVVYADTTTSVDEAEDPEQPSPDGYGSSVGIGVGRTNPSIVTFVLDGDGEPVPQGDAIFLATQPFSETEFSGAIPVFRSYPTSVTPSPDSQEWLVTMESSNALLVVSTEANDFGGMETMVDFASTDGGECRDCGMPFTSAQQGGFDVHSIAVVSTAVGPKGVVFDAEDRAMVHSWLDRAVESVPYSEASVAVRDLTKGDFRENLFVARGYQRVAEPSLPEDVEAGRRLFFSSLDSRMAASGAGISCSTCHMDGRNDGLTWNLRGQPRNTPSLAGPVYLTAPVTWSEEVDSVADEAMLTSSTRMGGQGLHETDALLIEAYINSTRYPDVPRFGETSDLVQQGEALFNRSDVGCGSCHNGDLYTDNDLHQIIGPMPTQTPTLRGIAASAPYFHDGSAPSLAAVVDMARDGSMGDTSMLSADERKALVAYLESL
ncbi:MAG: c-type cytochrome [Alphaproteobacteria bacterium]|nr:c-type cytochrome [Alphaproteobacteria bacterium]